MKKELIEEKGRSNGIGRPILYGTTKVFLKNFGFETIKDLPEIDDIGNAILEEEEKDSLYFQQIAIDLSAETLGTNAAETKEEAKEKEAWETAMEGDGEEKEEGRAGEETKL